MVKAFVHNKVTHFSPPSRGIALGWRLAISTASIVGLVMAGVSLGQQFFELKQHRQYHQKLLAMSMIPLVVRFEATTSLKSMEREAKEFLKPP